MDDYTAGELRERVQVQRVRYTPDGAGGQLKTWVDHVVLFAFVEEKSARENYADSSLGRIRTEKHWEFTTWKRGDITVQDRLVWADRLWDIRSVENLLARNKFIRIIAEAGVEQ